ncbi:probable LRR receptor-like serine/threonine-protein kinase At3g47570 [Camellia sinensis]|uniref:probable LRR receptor-like serine/threonine-protein kinase At3g47570 n=1 Tax=Camellia sinensis TaxID=4442 RepID=UPI001035551A|nr:probable LRR receptor-like serine/threonine-protein kinase At3g47570 [Camellia sinensis]
MIYKNNLTGSISPFANLSSFRRLSLAYNYFDGSIPDGFGRLKNLQQLALGANNLSSTIPHSLFNLFSLILFDVSMNQIQGSLPWDLGITLPNLKHFNIANNHFTGSIPVSITNASKLHLLEMVQNKFTRKVPNLARLHNLNWLILTSNQLGSEEADDMNFISSLINATNLQFLGVNINYFGCKFPKSIRNEFKALVYELMPNGSLEGWLHSSPKTNNGQNEHQRLNLLERINIAIDVACALDYLYHQCNTPIIHCDLMSSNILLDHDKVAHVGDFGLARFFLELTIPNQSSSIEIRGSIGYVPPVLERSQYVSNSGAK